MSIHVSDTYSLIFLTNCSNDEANDDNRLISVLQQKRKKH